MKIKYVISTMVFWWREHHLSFEQECDYLRNLGFGVEIWPTMRGHMDCRFAKRNWSRLKEATSGMTVALHSRDDGPTLDDWDEQLQCAAMLDAPVVTDLNSLCVSDQLQVADWGFVKDVVNLADQHHVTLCIENGNLKTLLKLGEKFNSIRYCFDTGHANLSSNGYYKECIDHLSERTALLHLTDNYGRLDDHEPPGVRGGIEKEKWDYLLGALQKHNNPVIASLQMIPAMPGTMIRHSSTFLFDVMGWPDKPAPKPGYDETEYRPL
ncbi:MAG: sugar phosphate isomerase/epimerase family protein [Planctomycetota bacterium]|jgi:sugar phosphate isomerase/epimerase